MSGSIAEEREKINRIDQQLVTLFAERMLASDAIGRYKRENGLPVRDPAREDEIIEALSQKVQPELRDSLIQLYTKIFEISRNWQEQTAAKAGEK